ncbi:MAG: hypothetical protein RL169_2124 [Armatimonadota bacterium]|jgi:hypothetical protein
MPMYTDNSPAYGRLYGSAFASVKQYCRGWRVNNGYDADDCFTITERALDQDWLSCICNDVKASKVGAFASHLAAMFITICALYI